ncbi:MFS transporter [Streptomyces sp. NPDC048349]|uniref:MFS transporter n=1 Tax=Streptomyces sp. NPDC048349 TaxID=3155486 RepID=UPI0034188FD8
MTDFARLRLVYLLTGVVNAQWGACLPALDARLDLGEGRLGGVLLAMGLSAMAGMTAAGHLAARPLLAWTAPATALALAGPAVADGYGALIVAAGFLGLLLGGLNVVLTLHATAAEHAHQQPIMSRLHALWTVGAVGGGLAVAAALHAGIGVKALLAVNGFALAVVMGVVTFRVQPPVPRPAEPGTSARRNPLLVVAMGLLGAAAFLTEGAATDWAGVHARRVLDVTPAVASLAYTAFLTAMTVVRLAGDLLRSRLGPSVTLRTAGLATATGLLLVITSSATGPLGAYAGWALAGAGMALIWPVLASTAGHGTPRQLSTITTLSYSGSLVGPAAIAYIAASTSLPTALALPAALALLLAVTGPAGLGAWTGTTSTAARERKLLERR